MEIPGLEIQLLGEIAVVRDGGALALPPSKKTRALLAYLALTPRAVRRDQLCDLFWDVTDDPRGALRWSLSKLRGLLDAAAGSHIEATREDVTFRARDARIDALVVKKTLAGRALDELDLDELERLAAMFRGEMLEGLDLADFDTYQAWCVAQREEMRGVRATLLAELVHRLAGDPARALAHARTLVQLDPHDAQARAKLISILGALGRRDEAHTHVETGRKRAAESRSTAAAQAIEAAWRGVERAPAAPQAPVPAREVDLRACAPLVGRTAELAALDGVGTSRRFAAMLIGGDVGAGKSRLVHAWAADARTRGATIAIGASLDAGAGRPYGPWLDVLRQLAGSEDQRSELARLARGTSEATTELDRERLFDGVAGELARAAPLVVVLEDSHWLDAGSAGLLAHVARACADAPLVVVMLARAGELADNAELGRALRVLRQLGVLDERELAPLSAAETGALVRAIAPAADVERIHARAGGNPLFALELARAAGDALPPSIAAAIRDRLGALPDDAAQVLRWGAVLGAVELDVLEAIGGLSAEAIVDALELLERRALLARDPARPGGYVFAHELVRQVVYDGLSEPRRRLMHRRIAQWFAPRAERGEVDIGLVAHHAAQAQDAALAAETCLAAARRSLRVFAATDALALGRRGMRHAEALGEPDRTRRTLELLEVCLAARRPDELEPVARQVEELAERALDLGCVEHARLGYHLLAYLRWEHGSWLEARRHMLHAQLISKGASEAEQIVGLAEAARCLVLLEKDLGQAQALALEAAARGRLAGVEPPAMFAALGMLNLHRGRVDDARGDLERALAVARARRDRHDEYQALEQLVMLDVDRGDPAAAAPRADELAVLGAKFRDGSEAPFARGLAALVRLAERQAELDAALDELAAVDAKHRLAYLASRAAWLDAEAGAYDRAARRAHRALAAAAVLDRATELALARAVLARVAQATRDDAQAGEHRAAIALRWERVAASVQQRIGDLAPTPADRPEEPEEDA